MNCFERLSRCIRLLNGLVQIVDKVVVLDVIRLIREHTLHEIVLIKLFEDWVAHI